MRIILFIAYCFVYSFAGAQSIPQLISPAPVSPNAASLGKYGEIPVNLGSGVPSISIPLYTINSGNISIPISLSYHAGGIKVEEAASWVGLGWSLSAGGAISRVCRGLPDEDGPGFRNMGYKVRQYGSMTLSDQETYLQSVEFREIDAEPDIFYYNFGGYSGKFFYNNYGQVVSMPLNNLKITYIEQPQHGWEIVTPDGSKYLFNEAEITTTTVVGGDEGSPVSMETTWYLKQATDIYSNTIEFFYDEEEYSFSTQGQESARLTINSSTGQVQPYTSPFSPIQFWNQLQGKKLSKINFINGEINFIASSQPRQDVADFSLSKIEIKTSNTVLKEYVFNTSYFNNSDPNTKRLKLDNITEISASIEGAKYIFQYNSTGLPARLSFAQDHWGYYNGANNSSLLGFIYNGVQIGANKEPNPQYTQAGILEKITYPTGGFSQFEFENNDVKKWEPAHYGPPVSFAGLAGQNYNNFTDTDLWFEQPFTVTTTDLSSEDQLAHFTVGIGQAVGENPFEYNYFISFFIYDQNNNLIFFGLDTHDGQSLNLPAGSYTMKVHISLDIAGVPEIYCTMNLLKRAYIPGQYVTVLSGGLRVKKITTQTSASGTPEVKVFKYNKFGESLTSGTQGNNPTYTYPITLWFPTGTWSYSWYSVPGLFASSNSTYPLSTTGGSYVIYENVTTELGVNTSEGKTESTFTSFAGWSDMFNSSFPFPPPTSRDHHRGLLLLETKYKKTTSGFEKVYEEENIYHFSRENPNDQVTVETDGIKLGRNLMGPSQCCPNFWDRLEWTYYLTESEFSHLKTKKVRLYNTANPATFLESITTSQHSPTHFQPIQITTTNSKGEEHSIYSKYPHEMQSVLSPNIYNDMVTKHIWSPIIEQSLFKNPNSFLNSSKTNYNYWYNGTWGTNTNGSLIVPQTIESKTLTTNPIITGRYHSYDSKGHITTVSHENDITKSYIWGYNNSYPIAEVTGISYASAIAVLSQSILDNPSSDQALRTELNKIRTSFPAAFVVTYTFNPLIGMTSQTDANGKITFYEYDVLGRLYLVRDQNNNILKKICYNYQGQVENCQ